MRPGNGSVLSGATSCFEAGRLVRQRLTSLRLKHPGGQKSGRPCSRSLALRAENRHCRRPKHQCLQSVNPTSPAATGDLRGDRGETLVNKVTAIPAATGDLRGDRGDETPIFSNAKPAATGDLRGDRGPFSKSNPLTNLRLPAICGVTEGENQTHQGRLYLRLPAICGVTEGAGFN